MNKYPQRLTAGFPALLLTIAAAAVGASANQDSSKPASQPVPEDRVEALSATSAEIGWTLAPGQLPITAAELWYTADGGASWQKAPARSGPDMAAANPAVFRAPGEGVFGLYLVLTSPAGRTPLPATGDPAHRWVRFDHTPPVVKLLAAGPDAHFHLSRELDLRWTVEDASLPDRPVSIHYRGRGDRSYQLAQESLAATGQIRWTVPVEVTGRITLKISAVDRAGNRGLATREIDLPDTMPDAMLATDGGSLVQLAAHGDKTIDAGAPAPQTSPAALQASSRTPDNSQLDRAPAAPANSQRDNSQPRMANAADSAFSEPDAGEAPPLTGAAREAARLYDLATWHRLRGEHEMALARYRDALALAPSLKAARVDMAGVLVLLARHDAAEAEYRQVLETHPRDRLALQGLAQVQARTRRYASAHATLQKLLLLAPDDGEAWLQFGDVCMFLADRHAAREAWNRAAACPDASDALKRRAAARLERYAGAVPGANVPGTTRD